MTTELETPSQLAKRVGVPVANIRGLINNGLIDHIYLTPSKKHAKIPKGAWERYLENFMLKAPDRTNQASNGRPK